MDAEARREEAAQLLHALTSREHTIKAALGARVAASVAVMVRKVHATAQAALATPGQSTGHQTPAGSEQGDASSAEPAALSERLAAAKVEEVLQRLAAAKAEAEASAAPRFTGPGGLVRVREIELELAELRAQAAQARLDALREEDRKQAEAEQARRRSRGTFAARAAADSAEKQAAAMRDAVDWAQMQLQADEDHRRAEQFEALQLDVETRLSRHGQLVERNSKLDEIQAALSELEQQRELARKREAERQEQAQAQEAEALRLASEEAAARIRVAQAERARKEAEHAAARARAEEEAHLLADRAADEERARLLAAKEKERAQEVHEELMAGLRQQETEMRKAREAAQAEAEAEEAALQQMVAQMRQETGNPHLSEEECAQASLKKYMKNEKKREKERRQQLEEIDLMTEILSAAQTRKSARDREKIDAIAALEELMSMEARLDQRLSKAEKRQREREAGKATGRRGTK
eukprot:Tamp_14937.p1 GENE.Tamp_14937~~Tamp_14937.p1  ORF type:complete len:501 (+),score=168.79 Tamp_14937:98-1504(+)